MSARSKQGTGQTGSASVMVPILVAIIGLGGTIGAAVITDSHGRQATLAELQPTIQSLQTQASIVQSLPTPLTSVHNVVAIETIENTVFSFSGSEGATNPTYQQGTGKLKFLWVGSDVDYKFEYSLPQTDGGFAGFTFLFTKEQDFTTYNYVEIEISFEQGALCDIMLMDKAGQQQYVRLGDKEFVNGVGVESEQRSGRQTIKIPLRTNFKAIDQTKVAQIGFTVNTDFVRGDHAFTVHNIKLRK